MLHLHLQQSIFTWLHLSICISITDAYKYCYINPRQRGSERRALLEYAVEVSGAGVKRSEAVAGTKYEQRLKLFAWHNTYIFDEAGSGNLPST